MACPGATVLGEPPSPVVVPYPETDERVRAGTSPADDRCVARTRETAPVERLTRHPVPA